ncbi:MAG: 4Fe-4S binding protein, partial [Desulfamplus sp.]|nr:4Fe-4S binding protein [Desulfamplus sp.]
MLNSNQKSNRESSKRESSKRVKIVFVRRISQIFFLALFFWFCIVSTIGVNWWQLRGWSVNWFLELDPLVGFSTLLTTGKIYKSLLWGVLTIILTLICGRFFCGWLCPFGTLHQFIGFCGKRKS